MILWLRLIKKKYPGFKNSNKEKISDWWKQIEKWREKKSLSFREDKRNYLTSACSSKTI